MPPSTTPSQKFLNERGWISSRRLRGRKYQTGVARLPVRGYHAKKFRIKILIFGQKRISTKMQFSPDHPPCPSGTPMRSGEKLFRKRRGPSIYLPRTDFLWELPGLCVPPPQTSIELASSSRDVFFLRRLHRADGKVHPRAVLFKRAVLLDAVFEVVLHGLHDEEIAVA